MANSVAARLRIALRIDRAIDPRTGALIGLAGAVLSGIGDVLILGRPASGSDFDRAAGMIPPHVDADPRWQSMWNGVGFTPRRIRTGTWIGVVGIGSLQWLGLNGIARGLRPGPARRLAEVSATVFAASGVLTHLCCGEVILAYRRAATEHPPPAKVVRYDSPGGVSVDAADQFPKGAADPRPSPRSVTALLGASAVGTLAALATLSGALISEAARGGGPAPTSAVVVTPFPYVLATLLGFGALPGPVAGYVRPASISIGLMAYFATAFASAFGTAFAGAASGRR